MGSMVRITMMSKAANLILHHAEIKVVTILKSQVILGEARGGDADVWLVSLVDRPSCCYPGCKHYWCQEPEVFLHLQSTKKCQKNSTQKGLHASLPRAGAFLEILIRKENGFEIQMLAMILPFKVTLRNLTLTCSEDSNDWPVDNPTDDNCCLQHTGEIPGGEGLL